MQYLVSVIDDKSNPGSTDRQPAISAFNERLIAEGYWVFGRTRGHRRGHGHRQPGRPRGIQRRAFRGVEGVPRRRLGVGRPDLDVALKLAAEASKVCDRKIEVRPFA
jgi:hypothetical protein